MGMIEIVVALCLQAEPSACHVVRERHPGAVTVCATAPGDDEQLIAAPGWYLARFSCRWRG